MKSAICAEISLIWCSSSCFVRSLIEFNMSLIYSAIEMVNRYAPIPSDTIEASRKKLYAISPYCNRMATQYPIGCFVLNGNLFSAPNNKNQWKWMKNPEKNLCEKKEFHSTHHIGMGNLSASRPISVVKYRNRLSANFGNIQQTGVTFRIKK